MSAEQNNEELNQEETETVEETEKEVENSQPATAAEDQPSENDIFEDEEPEAGSQKTATEEDDEQPDEGDVIDKLLGFLEETLQNPEKGTGFMGRPQINVDKCLDIIDNIRQNMPVSLQYSAATSTQRERILGNAEQIARDHIADAKAEAAKTIEDANKEADDIVANAQSEADTIRENAHAQAEDIIEKAKRKAMHLKNEQEILKEAKRDASELRSNTAAEAKETRRKALSDAWLVYEAVQKQLIAMEAKLDKYMNELSEPEEPEN